MPGDAQELALVIRPEQVRLDSIDGWQGTVVERVFKGSTMLYRVQLEDGSDILAEVAHDDIAHRHDVGDVVTLNFRPQNASLVPGTVGAG